MTSPYDHQQLDLAVRLAVRGHGRVEPNPMVGCVIEDASGRRCGAAGHRCFGGPHAEVLALEQAGSAARGGTAFVTLEPCAHHGKTPPCVEALIAAGIRRVVIGAPDPHAVAAGGADRLREAGVDVAVLHHAASLRLLAPFRTPVTEGRPWITMKWAQSRNGFIADANGRSQWISSAASRRLVHRERGRVDAILTGMGTVHHDDPRLTARGVRRRRRALRVVLDRSLDMPLTARLISTLGEAPLLIVTDDRLEASPRASALRDRGVTVMGHPCADDRFDLPSVTTRLLEEHAVSTILVEAGAGVMSSLVTADCVDELAVFLAPSRLPGPPGLRPLDDAAMARLADPSSGLTLEHTHVREADVLLRYRFDRVTDRRGPSPTPAGEVR